MKIRPVGSALLQADGQIDAHGVAIVAFAILRRRQKKLQCHGSYSPTFSQIDPEARALLLPDGWQTWRF